MSVGIKAKENWRKRFNKELMQLFGDLDVLSFVRISRLKWTAHVDRMESTRKMLMLTEWRAQEK